MKSLAIDVSRGETTSMTLEDFVGFVHENVDLEDFASIKEAAWALRALGNDRDFILEAYNRELASILSSTSRNVLTPQTIVLAQEREFYLRSNIWLPPSAAEQFREREAKLTAYGLAHDHNFHFLTLGYYGEGYETDIYRYDYRQVAGYLDEDAGLEFLGRYRLKAGEVMAYEAGRDVHVQYEPKDIAVSINFIAIPQSTYFQQQMSFDLERGTIAAGLTDSVGTRLFLLSFLKENHDQETVRLLERAALDYPCLRTRSQALRILGEIDPGQHAKILPSVDKNAQHLAQFELVHAGQARQIDAA